MKLSKDKGFGNKIILWTNLKNKYCNLLLPAHIGALRSFLTEKFFVFIFIFYFIDWYETI